MLTRRDIEDCNWNSKSFSTRTRISRCARTLLVPPIPASDSSPPFCFIGELGTQLARTLLAIPGVTAMWIDLYSFEIIKIREIAWLSIENGVATILTQAGVQLTKEAHTF